MPPNTEGSGPYSSGTKVLLADGPDIRKRINIQLSGPESNQKKTDIAKKSQAERGLSFHIKKLAWTLFTIPICRAIVFVIFAIVSLCFIILSKQHPDCLLHRKAYTLGTESNPD